MEEQGTCRKRELVGKVISDKMNKTVVVEVERRVLHPKYRKFVKQRSKYHAHDEDNTYQNNDEVVIREHRPLSKKKRWIVVGYRQ